MTISLVKCRNCTRVWRTNIAGITECPTCGSKSKPIVIPV